MKKPTVKYGLGLVAIATALMIGTAALGYAYKPPTSRERATIWLAENAINRPTEYAGIASQPIQWRRPLFGLLTSREKMALWKAHLESFVLPDAALTAVQLGVRTKLNATLSAKQVAQVQAVIAQLPELFSATKSLVERQTLLHEVCALNKSMFTRRETIAIFGLIGELDDTPIGDWPANQPQPAASQTNVQTASVLPGAAFVGLLRIGLATMGIGPTACNCNSGSWCSCWGGDCNGSNGEPGSCRVTSGDQEDGDPGCGCLWIDGCDGKCSEA